MTFDLQTIAIFSVGALLYSAFLPKHWRGWALMIGSVIAIYWLQSPIVVGKLDFIFPTTTIIITVALWWFTRIPDEKPKNGDDVRTRYVVSENVFAFIIITALVIGMSMMRYIDKTYRLTPSKPPDLFTVIPVLAVIGVVIYAIHACLA